MTEEQHHKMQKCLDAGVRIYGNQKRQIEIEKNDIVVKKFNLKHRENMSLRLIDAWVYYSDYLESL
jgi:hypothetical protein